MQKHRILRYMAALSLLFCVLSVNAATVERLYEVAYPVETQQAQERKAAIEQALLELLVRVTGNSQIAELPQTVELLEKASGFVRQFQYSVRQNENSPFGESRKEQAILNVVFDEVAIKQALWKHNLPVWGKTRPATLLWIAIQDSEKRYLLDANNAQEIVDVMNAQAQKRGIPVIYPLMDLEDQMNIKVSDVWGGFIDNISGASSRYPAEEILSGRIFLDPFGTWQARWTLIHGTEQTVWQISGEDLTVVLEQGMHGLADNVAVRYASTASDDAQVGLQIRISDIKDINSLVRATKYLESLSQIAKIHLAKVESTRATFQIELRSEQQALARAISLGRTLMQDTQETDEEQVTLAYRLIQ
ncbi:MAG: DUF2066 domain-containing protein [Gammaproteobacteria bacterium]|nr:DUF2066 domain-containing protein [Gammaproteobacteria bacterium]